MKKVALLILAGITACYQMNASAEPSVFRGMPDVQDYRKHVIRGYDFQPESTFVRDCRDVYGCNGGAYYRDYRHYYQHGFRRVLRSEDASILREHH